MTDRIPAFILTRTAYADFYPCLSNGITRSYAKARHSWRP